MTKPKRGKRPFGKTLSIKDRSSVFESLEVGVILEKEEENQFGKTVVTEFDVEEDAVQMVRCSLLIRRWK